MELKILFEDNHLIVVIKPVNVLSQKDSTNEESMLEIIKSYIKEKYNKPGNVFLGLVHRLDRMTSGIMVFAKTSKAASRLNEQIRSHLFKKKYLALIEGEIHSPIHLENYLLKDEKIVKSNVVQNGGKLSILEAKPLKTIGNKQFIEVDLKTGRHHQIRCQLANINHPLVGDKLYGSKYNSLFKLHAYYLCFSHPITKALLEFVDYPEWFD